MTIEIIDCTLRDGGYVNNWSYNNSQIRNIVSALNNSNIDNIECGYLSSGKTYSGNSTRFNLISQANDILKQLNTQAKLLLMIDFREYSINDLQPKNDNIIIDGIRIAFHKKDYQEIFSTAKEIINKGYKLFLQPMQTSSYDKDEINNLIEISNKLSPEAVYIVDSFGNLYPEKLGSMFEIFDNNLKKEIKIGFHGHNNLQLAYYNSVFMIGLNNSKRNIIIDSSLAGIARGGGNLNTEMIASYLNKFENKYNLATILDLIEDKITDIFQDETITNKIPYFISAISGCHPSYIKYFKDKKLKLSEIKRLTDIMQNEYLSHFDIKYADEVLKFL